MTNSIHKSSYKPAQFYFSNPNERLNKLHFGFELELEFQDKYEFINAFNISFRDEKLFFLKEDCSLSPSMGIEIVSNPITFDYLIENKIFFVKLFDLINLYNGMAQENCGLHFHLDRKFLTYTSTAIIDMLVNTYKSFFEKLGERQENDYSHYIHKTRDEWGRCTYNHLFDRYTAVNLTNTDTVELRFFHAVNDFSKFLNKVKIINLLGTFANKFDTFEDFMFYYYYEHDFEKVFLLKLNT